MSATGKTTYVRYAGGTAPPVTTDPAPSYGSATPLPAHKALTQQVGGSHYKDMKIQPVAFCMANGLNFCVSSAIKYLCRYPRKNGREDLLKARHFIDMLIELEYPDNNGNQD